VTEFPDDALPFGGSSADELDRLLAEPDQAPAELAGLAALVQAVRGPAEAGPQPGEQAALAAYREIVAGRRAARVRRIGARLAVAGASGALVLTGGVAAAATGSLPAGAQQFAHHVFGAVGWHVPPGHQKPNPHRPEGPAAKFRPEQAPGPHHVTPVGPGHDNAPGAVSTPAAPAGAGQPGQPGQVAPPATVPGHGRASHVPTPTPSPVATPHGSPTGAPAAAATRPPEHHGHPE
jgi:hypothetical protein